MDATKQIDLDNSENRKNICEWYGKYIPPKLLNHLIEEIKKDCRFERLKQKVYPYEIGGFGQSAEKNIDYDIANIVAKTYYYYISLLKYRYDLSSLNNNKDFLKIIKETYFYEANFKNLLIAPEKVAQNIANPIIFTMACLARALTEGIGKYKNQIIGEDANYEGLFKYNFLVDCVNHCHSVLNCLISGDVDCAKSSLRTLLETYITYKTISTNKKAIYKYYSSLMCKVCRLEDRNLSKTDSILHNVSKCPSNNEIDYGWFRILKPDQEKGNISFKNILDFYFLDNLDLSNNWNKVYVGCSISVHGNQLVYLDTSLGLYDVAYPLSVLILSLTKDIRINIDFSSSELSAIDFLINHLKDDSRDLKYMMLLSNRIWIFDIERLEMY